jgi:hypothetical protein
MALRPPLQTIGTLGTSLWQLQVTLRPYTSRKGFGRTVIGRIFSMDEKRAVHPGLAHATKGQNPGDSALNCTSPAAIKCTVTG